jgi:hypothetical protein
MGYECKLALFLLPRRLRPGRCHRPWFYNRTSPEHLTVVSEDADTAYSLWSSVLRAFPVPRQQGHTYVRSALVPNSTTSIKVMVIFRCSTTLLPHEGDGRSPWRPQFSCQQQGPHLQHRLRPQPKPTLRHPQSFLKTCSMLQLEEHRINKSEKL